MSQYEYDGSSSSRIEDEGNGDVPQVLPRAGVSLPPPAPVLWSHYNEYLLNMHPQAYGQPETYSVLPVGHGNFLKVYHCQENAADSAGLYHHHHHHHHHHHPTQPQPQFQQAQYHMQPAPPQAAQPPPPPPPIYNSYELFASNTLMSTENQLNVACEASVQPQPLLFLQQPQQQQQQQQQTQQQNTSHENDIHVATSSNRIINKLVNNWSPNLTGGTYTQFGAAAPPMAPIASLSANTSSSSNGIEMPAQIQLQQQQQQQHLLQASTLPDVINNINPNVNLMQQIVAPPLNNAPMQLLAKQPLQQGVDMTTVPLETLQFTHSNNNNSNHNKNTFVKENIKQASPAIVAAIATTTVPEVKKRIVAEVKPMRMTYSDVLSKVNSHQTAAATNHQHNANNTRSNKMTSDRKADNRTSGTVGMANDIRRSLNGDERLPNNKKSPSHDNNNKENMQQPNVGNNNSSNNNNKSHKRMTTISNNNANSGNSKNMNIPKQAQKSNVAASGSITSVTGSAATVASETNKNHKRNSNGNSNNGSRRYEANGDAAMPDTTTSTTGASTASTTTGKSTTQKGTGGGGSVADKNFNTYYNVTSTKQQQQQQQHQQHQTQTQQSQQQQNQQEPTLTAKPKVKSSAGKGNGGGNSYYASNSASSGSGNNATTSSSTSSSYGGTNQSRVRYSNASSNSSYSYSSKRSRGGGGGGNFSNTNNNAPNRNYELAKRFLRAWAEYTIKILMWLFYLVYDIVVLGFHMVYERLVQTYVAAIAYGKQLRTELQQNSNKPSLWLKQKWRRFDARFAKNSPWAFWRRFYPKRATETVAPETFKTGRLPQTGEEAMYSLLNCKGKDAYSILGVPSDSSQEQIRKHYKKIAVLVHPDKNKQAGAEEAFKVLQRAFELIGEPENRLAYDQSLAEALHAEKAWTELHDLLSQLQTKITEAANTIRCSTCGLRHPRKLTDRPHYAARECASCKIRHAAREGDIWAETSLLGMRWKYLALMEAKVYDITEWANCQKGALSHLEPNSHVVQYRIVRGAQQQQQQQQNQQQQQQQHNQQQQQQHTQQAYHHHHHHHHHQQQQQSSHPYHHHSPGPQQYASHTHAGPNAGMHSHDRNGGSGKYKRDIPPSEATLHEFLDNLYSGQNPMGHNQAGNSNVYSNASRRRARRN